MNALQAFETRKDDLAAQLRQAQTPEQGITACVMALEQTACLLAQQEQDEHARQRQLAVMAIARSAPQLLRGARAQGELILVPQEEAQGGRKLHAGNIAQIAGAFLLGALAVHELLSGETMFALMQLLGGGLLFAGGLRAVPGAPEQGHRARGVLALDDADTVRQLAQLCHAADVCVGDLTLLEQEAGTARLSGTADEAMLDLLMALMEAKASGRDDLAMRSLSLAEQYLRMLGMEAVFYGSGHDELFDRLPTLGEARTIRPALVRDGRVIRRGTAACPMERSVQR